MESGKMERANPKIRLNRWKRITNQIVMMLLIIHKAPGSKPNAHNNYRIMDATLNSMPSCNEIKANFEPCMPIKRTICKSQIIKKSKLLKTAESMTRQNSQIRILLITINLSFFFKCNWFQFSE